MVRYRLVALLFILSMAGCASHAPAPVGEVRPPTRIEPARPGTVTVTASVAPTAYYTVKKGDTLFSIALDHGVDYRELAVWNNIVNINRIRIGQQLRVNAPGATTTTTTTTTAVSATDASAQTTPVSGAAEVRPIALGGSVVARPLDAEASASTIVTVSPAPIIAPENTESLKRGPKGGKLPYSEENLARLKAQGTIPQPAPAAPATPALVTAPVVPVAAAATATTAAAIPAEKPMPAAAEGDVDWAWPATGKLLATFNEGGGGQEAASKGIDIAGKLGDPVQAAAGGKVVYVGSGLRGYGNLVIVRHNATFLSAYAHNSRILVKEGQAVTRGQKIAELGNSDTDQPKLHFEVRQQGKPVDPLKFLPGR